MKLYFPEIYPDELVYSWLARYYIKTGYMRYSIVAEELFQQKTVRPDIEFLNQYTPIVQRTINEKIPMQEVVEKHTMFPYYGRFLSYERRNLAFTEMVQTKGNYYNLLPMPKKKRNTERHLRYCPMCARNDRNRYGEAYWHRMHQIQGITVCAVHKCYLLDSSVKITAKTSPALIALETVVPDAMSCPLLCQNDIEHRLAEYIAEVFEAKLNLQNDGSVGSFLHFKMENTRYRSVRGEQRNISKLHTDFLSYYKNLPDNSFSELWQIQKVLTGDRINTFEICMIALFLEIPATELVEMKMPKMTQEQRFDEQIYRLQEKGIRYPEIARILGASYHTVKAVGEQRYKKHHKKTTKASETGKKAYDWKQIDADTLPLVEEAIVRLRGDGNIRPRKVTIFAVEKMLQLPSKRISTYLPKCRGTIEKAIESQEEYWARETVWAVEHIMREGQTLNWKQIRNLTNMRKKDFEKCMPYLCKFTNVDTVKKIKMLI